MDSVKKHYLDPCERFAMEIDMHFRDQIRCSVTGDTPKWQKSVNKSAYNKALKESKASVDAQGIVRKSGAKRPTKKRS
jgi:hypothetical protein